tara:strand:- start:1241 stop:1891 length:651 start_codon:yes stop_codon:yes gene_type:complete
MSFTFAELKTAIQDYTENTETSFVTNLPVFIRAAERRILSLVDLEYFRKNVTGSMTTGDKFLAVPDDYLASFSLSILDGTGATVFLLQKDVNFVQEYNPNSATTGEPIYYAIFDVDNFIIGPTPNSNYTSELHYFYEPASLTAGADSGTTWLSTNAPNSLLYGSLVEAYTFMKGENALLTQYNTRFSESLQRLKDLGEARENTDAYRIGLPRRART